MKKGATNIRVSFEAPPGVPVRAVDRGDPKQPWIKHGGDHVVEVLQLEAPSTVTFELRGGLASSYVSSVAVHEAYESR